MVAKQDGEALARERRAVVEISKGLKGLESLTLAQLQKKHLEWFGVETHTHNKAFLQKKLAYRLQERAEGGVSPATLARLVELVPSLQAVRQERKTQPSRAAVASAPGVVRDPRLPDVGTLLRRPYQGKVHEVEVLAQGFRFRGKVHGSLSSIARVITGTNWNGFVFFGLVGRKEQP